MPTNAAREAGCPWLTAVREGRVNLRSFSGKNSRSEFRQFLRGYDTVEVFDDEFGSHRDGIVGQRDTEFVGIAGVRDLDFRRIAEPVAKNCFADLLFSLVGVYECVRARAEAKNHAGHGSTIARLAKIIWAIEPGGFSRLRR